MRARFRRSLDKREEGFTLIELLVVMIIIGILAAIAIPVFLSQRAKGRDTSTKADISTIGKEIATYYVDGTGTPAPVFTAAAAPAAAYVTITDAGTYTSGQIKLSSGTAPQGTTAVPVGTDFTSARSFTSTPTSATWCVGLTNPGGSQKDYKYSAAGGLASGSCP